MGIRSGHVSFVVPNTGTASATITSGGAGAVYRIFNSGGRGPGSATRIFTVRSNGADLYTNLGPTLSFDVAVDSGLLIESGQNNSEIKATYDLLRGADGTLSKVDGRSGRFNLPPAFPGTMLPHKIVDLTYAPDSGVYRIFNAGENDFTVEINNQLRTTTVTPVTIAPRQSRDFDLTDATRRCIFVNRTAVVRIEGIYELVD